MEAIFSHLFRFVIVVVLYGLFSLQLGLCAQAQTGPNPTKEIKALVTAAMQEDTAAMQRLLDAGTKVDAPVEDGRSLLFYAIAYQKVKTVAFLLMRGADLHARDRDGKTPLHWAVTVSTPLTDLLVEKGRGDRCRR